ncbi:ABC transporter, permease [Moorella glycerini]|uniref:Autoinducer 2 import system permease protein LsrD n=1 Tax=Neomoorella stamsii TaxID=1266720 RepID=A0A9X7J0P5_9FIRM|nr:MULTISPECIES: ABC transporter permease [Moorella]PRR71083.1 Autoinducer 2 import system permease protein LsrD [Moorella stamsii]CEP66018.1 ABC transporter, permease [Moorella glycerini]
MSKTSKEMILLYVFVSLFILMSLISPSRFLSLQNLQSMASQLPELGIMALGMMVVIITGGIDLSITFTAALSGIAGAFVLSSGYNAEVAGAAVLLLIMKAVLVALITAFICGLINGFLVSYVGVSPILVTLGTMTLFEGLSIWLTKGGAISGFPEQYQWFGNGYLLFVPVPLLIFVTLAVLTGVLLERTAWGRSVYMFGCNPVATYFSGINTKKVVMFVYLYAATMAAVAALIMTSRYNSAKVDYGSSYLLQSVAIVVLGGTDIAGGYGKVIGTVIAVGIVQVLSSGLNLIGINRFIVDVTIGALLIAVLLLNYLISTRNQRKGAKKEQNKMSIAV